MLGIKIENSKPYEEILANRQAYLKEQIHLVEKLRNENLEYLTIDGNSISSWEKFQVQENIKNIELKLIELKTNQDVKNIEDYSRLKKRHFLYDPDELSNQIFVVRNSLNGSRYLDLFLHVPEMPFGELLDLAINNKEPKSIINFLPERNRLVKEEVLPYLKDSNLYSEQWSIINEAMSCYEKSYFKATNLLLITGIESLLRKLADFLNVKQRLNLDFNKVKYHSIDGLLRNPNWKEDLPFSGGHLVALENSEYINNKIEEHENSESWEMFSTVNITLKARFGFLRRRFKDSRDLILHGQDTNYGNLKDTFLNMSTLYDLYTTLEEYDDIY